MPTAFQTITPTPQDTASADAGSRALSRLLDQNGEIRLRASDTEEIRLPINVARVVQDVLAQIGRGQTVVVLPLESQLTTSEAAQIIGVSRPFLIQLLEQGDLPFHLVGTHRRVRLADAVAYRQEKERQRGLLDELVREAQELNLGY